MENCGASRGFGFIYIYIYIDDAYKNVSFNSCWGSKEYAVNSLF